ncbi:hypothetical protein LQG66_17465 [Bradyrhizobium ontarionense]|uniref:Phasin domain-containing protein n=1 Tax=Bradyrhizobium ontarionense TaxID=2898149 RepID=A0ABY3RM96_9BRAD|nr:hypothetical protein [Bradyrhizobium sp. A19]UFZ07976.1 hypothetical protein LQG66_17465 [Bradyrhizobium sp. A19]
MPKRADSVAGLASSEGEELPVVPETETRLQERPGQESETRLPPVPPLELDAETALPSQLAELKPDVVPPPVEALAESNESERTATGEDRTAGASPKTDGPRRPAAGIEAYQALLMEMTRHNLDLAASFASMRSPLDLLGVATEFAGRRIDMYGRFTKAVADIATAPDAKAR